MKVEQSRKSQQLLRSIYPDIFDYFLEVLSSYNIYSYDVQVTCNNVDTGIDIYVYYGEAFQHVISHQFSQKCLSEIDHELTLFSKEVSERCKETLMADYFKMMKP